MAELPKVEPYGHTDNDFADKYRAYKDYVQSASAAFQKKDYATAITNYSKAIEMSPFEIITATEGSPTTDQERMLQ